MWSPTVTATKGNSRGAERRWDQRGASLFARAAAVYVIVAVEADTGRCLTLTSARGCFMTRLENGGAIRTWLAVAAFCSAAAFRDRRQQQM